VEVVTSPRTRADSFLVAATIAFAFLAASFPATNSDLWLHLASGRHVASGEWTIGRDPFSALTLGRYWVHHSWLFDLVAYRVFEAAGGATLVAIKAFGVALLAGIMVRIGLRSGAPVWLACLTTMFAILAMSPRLLVQPQCLSILLLAIGFEMASGRGRRWLPILLLYWVNVDAWFVLGLGLALTTRHRWTIALSVLACLINPHHVRAFSLPPELDPTVWNDPLRNNPYFAGFFASPWKLTGLASWAFPVLLGLGAISFVLNRRAIRDPRLAVWLPLAALACWQARLVPFFAAVAGPILAMNLGEALGPNALPRTGRRLALALAMFLTLLSWPGWLQSGSARDRALGWQIVPDASLARAAERFNGYGDPGAFTPNPETAHHLVWFAPRALGGVDSRLQLFTRLDPELRFDYAIATVNEVEAESSIDEVTGSQVIIDRRTPHPKFDAERSAFVRDGSLAPDLASLNEAAEWWNLAAHRQPPRNWEGDAAATYLRLFERVRGPERSPALPLLAIRASRSSLAASPRGDDVWVALARAYLFESRSSWVAVASSEFTLAKYLRHVQVVGALQQALIAYPDNAAAHELLAGAFGERRMIDLALRHRREQRRLTNRPELDEEIERLELALFDAENRFRVHTDELSGNPLQKARIARELGLGAVALDTLLKSHPDLYGIEGSRMLLDLLLQTGRLADARTFLDGLAERTFALDLFTLPGGVKNGSAWRYALPAFNWFDFCQRSAAGQYGPAEAALARLREQLSEVQSIALPNVRSAYLRTALSELSAASPVSRAVVHIERETWAANVNQTMFLASVRGDLHALSGLLNLERGAIVDAERDFARALERYAEHFGPSATHPGRPLAVRYRKALRNRP